MPRAARRVGARTTLAARAFLPITSTLALVCVLLFTLSALRAAQVESVINLTPFEVGHYDVNGELVRGPAQAGNFGDARGPRRSFLAFHVPQFTGTLARAELFLSYYLVDGPDGTER